MAFCNLDVRHDAVACDFYFQHDSSFYAGLACSARIALSGFDFSNNDSKNGILAAPCGVALPGCQTFGAAGGGVYTRS